MKTLFISCERMTVFIVYLDINGCRLVQFVMHDQQIDSGWFKPLEKQSNLGGKKLFYYIFCGYEAGNSWMIEGTSKWRVGKEWKMMNEAC